jgi:hypothetical protein
MSDTWLPPPASPGYELREERKEVLTSSSRLQIPEKHPVNTTPVNLPCSPDSGALQAVPIATCDSGHRSCSVEPSSAEKDLAYGNTNEDAESPVTPLSTCVELITPMQRTAATLVSPLSYSTEMSTFSALVDQCSPRDCKHPESTASELEASEPVLFLRPDALTPVPLADLLAGHSSPSLQGQNSELSTSPTTPLSSPRTEFDSADANDEAGERMASVTSETYDFPTRIMSSPGPSFGQGGMLSPSPPQQKTTGAKRPAYDSCDEVRRRRCLSGASYPTRARIGPLEGPSNAL